MPSRSPSHPQLAALAREFDDATAKLTDLSAGIANEAFRQRPRPERWSAAECVHHLNITSREFLPLLDQAIEEARRLPPPRDPTYRQGFVGWLLCRMLEPPYRQRLTTTAAFLPAAPGSKGELLHEFARLQDELISRAAAGAGLDLNRVRMQSPFNARMRYNPYSCFRILAAHQRRHLWQASQSLAATAGANPST
jgi:hypothetical protein